MSNSTESPHYPRLSDDSNVQINIVLKLQNYKKKKYFNPEMYKRL